MLPSTTQSTVGPSHDRTAPRRLALRAIARSRPLAVVAVLLAPMLALADPSPPGAAPPAAPAPTPATAPITVPVAPAPPAPIKVPSFELRDRGDAVEIIAHNVKAARTAISPVRSRLEVPLVGIPAAKRVMPSDATVKVIELDGEHALRVLSVKLGFERDDVKALARFAQAIQVGDDLHMIVPRKLPTDGTAPQLPAPTLPPALAAAVARADEMAPAAGAQRPAVQPAAPAAKPEAVAKLAAAPAAAAAAKPDAAAVAKPDANTAAAKPDAAAAKTDVAVAAAKPDAAAAPHDGEPEADARPAKAEGRSLRAALAPSSDDAWSKLAMTGALGLAAAGAGIWIMRRRRGQLIAPASIDVIAQRSLGGRARILWLSAGPRELIVSVTPQQVRLLGQWKKTDASPTAVAAEPQPAELPAAHSEPRFDFRHEATSRLAKRHDAAAPQDKPLSPAVSGILRLRGRTGQMPVADPSMTEVEPDDLWAKEILAATGARK